MTLDTKELIKSAFREVLENPGVSKDSIKKYFSEKYTQHVDGKTLNFEDFVTHIEHLHQKVDCIEINFLKLICEGSKACSVHIAKGKKKDGSPIQAKVIAFFEVEKGKIVLCDELTHILVGNDEDKEIGSS